MNFPKIVLPSTWQNLLFLALFCLSANKANSQCFNTDKFPVHDVSVPNFSGYSDTISIESYGGDFVLLIDLVVGKNYTFNSSFATDYLTIRNKGGIASDPVISYGITPQSFTATSHSLEVHISPEASPTCGYEEVDRITLISCDDCPADPPKVGIQTSNPAAILDVAGEIKISDTGLKPQAGTMRFNSSTSDFEGYDGTRWVSFTKANGSWGKVSDYMVEEDQKLVSSDGNTFDEFGGAVAIDSDYAVSGSALADPGSAPFQGKAYIFKRTDNTWTEDTILIAGDGASGDQFGKSVAIEGDYVVIGSPWNDIGGNSNQGSAYVYKRSGDTWALEIKLTAVDGLADDKFGTSVSINGDYIAISSPYASIGGNLSQGAAYIFKRTGNAWLLEAKISAATGAAYDQFGFAVSISGAYIAIGSHLADVDGATNQGVAYIYKRSDTSWDFEAELIGNQNSAGDFFGRSVALDGDYAIIGSPGDDLFGGNDQGSACVFKRTGTTWTEVVRLLSNDGSGQDYFGSSVSISGNNILIGNYGEKSSTGSAFIYNRSGETWSKLTKLGAGDPFITDRFGTSVSIKGDDIIVGCLRDDINGNYQQGSIYVFEKK